MTFVYNLLKVATAAIWGAPNIGHWPQEKSYHPFCHSGSRSMIHDQQCKESHLVQCAPNDGKLNSVSLT